jgi:predicted DNA-binding WGR domain protein
MNAPDFRDQEPVWVRYAEYVGGGHDKYYEARIDLGDDGHFWLTKRWGARPDAGAGQIKAEPYNTLLQATSAANEILNAKRRKGYTLCERPKGASNKVAHEYGHDYYADPEAF